jgi:hypothetical protein
MILRKDVLLIPGGIAKSSTLGIGEWDDRITSIAPNNLEKLTESNSRLTHPTTNKSSSDRIG